MGGVKMRRIMITLKVRDAENSCVMWKNGKFLWKVWIFGVCTCPLGNPADKSDSCLKLHTFLLVFLGTTLHVVKDNNPSLFFILLG